MKSFLRKLSCRAVLCCVPAILLMGCSTLWGPKPDIVSEEKTEGRAYSSADTRRILIDQPTLLSGDYFRERNPEETPQMTIGLAGEDQNVPADTRRAVAQSKWPRKIGLMFDDSFVTGGGAESLKDEAVRALPSGAVLVSPDRLRDVLASEDCGTDAACIAEKVSLYPGVRILVLAESLRLPKEFPGQADIRFQLIDADLRYTYPPVELRATLAKQPDVDMFLYHACRRAFADARRHADVMPPHARVFSVKDGRIFVNAGKSSGIETGAVFNVVSGGEPVYAPSGIPVGWVPGEPKGTVRVDMLVGDDVAGCSVVEGGMPAIGDYMPFD